MRRLLQLLRQESGATAVEYAVVLGLIALVCVTAVQNMTTATADSFNTSGDQLEGILGP